MKLRVLFLIASATLACLPAAALARPAEPWPHGTQMMPSPGIDASVTPIVDIASPVAEAQSSGAPTEGGAPGMLRALARSTADRLSDTTTHYTVRAGDTLWEIALHFGTTVSVLTNANRLGPYQLIVPGMDLLIPFSNVAGTARAGPNGPIVSGRGLHFVASVSSQACWLFDSGMLLQRWRCSTGRPEFPSIPGNYTVQTKLPRGYFVAGKSWMPDWLGIYEGGGTENGIHGIPYASATGERLWQNDVGTPITFGCVMLDDPAAHQLWAIAYVGMPVTILP